MVSNTVSISDACSCRLSEARRVPHVEQELLTLPDHQRLLPFFVGFVFPSLLFCGSLFILSLLVLCVPRFMTSGL
jgi:hypothetical protein